VYFKITGDWIEFKTQSRHLGPSFKLSPSILLLYSTPSTFLLQPTISSKLSLLLLQELPIENLFFDRSRADPYSPLLSHQHCNFFLFRLLIFAVKLKHTNCRVYHLNRHGLRYSCRVHIFCRRDNQSS
jgi:hypothetical protein